MQNIYLEAMGDRRVSLILRRTKLRRVDCADCIMPGLTATGTFHIS
jgi:hypothetical protein